MKDKSFIFFLIYILLALSLPGTISCKKDNDILFYQDRITASNYYENDTLKSTRSFLYNNNQLDLIKSCYFLLGTDSLKTEINYIDENNISQDVFYYYALEWWEVEKISIQLEYGKIVKIEDRYFDGSYWDYLFKKEYKYKSGNLIEEVLYYHEYDAWTPEEMISYEYEMNKPVEVLYYDYNNGWILKYKEVASYTGNKTDSINGFTYSDSSFTKDARYEYLYEDDRLMKINAYWFDEGWQYSGDVTFTYNPHFKLEKEEMNMPTFSNRYEYTYEEGLGNYTQLLMPGGGLVPVKYYPAPVKSAKVNLPQGHGGTEIPRASVSPW